MKYLLIGLLICLAITSCQNHKVALEHGTTAVVYVDFDSTILAADSRSMRTYSNGNLSYTDTAKKIFRKGSTFFVMTGWSTFGGSSMKSIVNSTFKEGVPLDVMAKAIQVQLISAMNREIAKMPEKAVQQMKSQVATLYDSKLFLVRYENSVPNVASLETNFNIIAGKVLQVSPGKVALYKRFGYALQGGIYDHIVKLMATHPPMNNRLSFVMNLIKLEARHHSEVDSNISYVVLKKNNVRVGRNYR